MKPSAYYFYVKTKITVGFYICISKEDSPPDPQMLYEKVVTEAVVSSIAIINNKMSLPVTVDYFPKSRRKGNALTEVFMQHLRILQMCLPRTMKAKPDRLIISDYSNRVLFFVFLFFCQDCFSSNEVSSEQNTLGHVSTYLTLRACQNCINEKVHYKSYCHCNH